MAEKTKKTAKKPLGSKVTKEVAKDMVTPEGGKVAKATKMGAPRKERKLKPYSIRLVPEDKEEFEIVMGTVNAFTQDMVEKCMDDPMIMVKLLETVYGKDSTRVIMAKAVAEQKAKAK